MLINIMTIIWMMTHWRDILGPTLCMLPEPLFMKKKREAQNPPPLRRSKRLKNNGEAQNPPPPQPSVPPRRSTREVKKAPALISPFEPWLKKKKTG